MLGLRSKAFKFWQQNNFCQHFVFDQQESAETCPISLKMLFISTLIHIYSELVTANNWADLAFSDQDQLTSIEPSLFANVT